MFSAVMTPFLDIAFLTEEAIGCINEAAIDTIIAPRNPLSCFFISCFTHVAPLVNRPNFSSDSAILIISCISSFEINEVNPFPALTTLFSLIQFSNLLIAFEAAFEAILFTNPAKHL